jgi:hypothetical protein
MEWSFNPEMAMAPMDAEMDEARRRYANGEPTASQMRLRRPRAQFAESPLARPTFRFVSAEGSKLNRGAGP